MTQRFMCGAASGKTRRMGVLGVTCTAALLTIQPMLMPFVARADNGNNDNGGYSNTVNGAQGKIAAGTLVKVHLLDPVSSSTAHVGDRFRVAVASDDTSGLPSGTVFFGQVTQVTPGTPNSAGSVALQLALPRGSYAFDQYDNGNNNGNSGYNGGNAPPTGPNGNYNASSSDNGNGPNAQDSYTPAPNTPAAGAYGNNNGPGANNNGSGPNGQYSNNGGPVPDGQYSNNSGSGPNGQYSGNNGPYGSGPGALTISNDASASFTGHSPKSAGHTAGIAAAAGALLGFARKRKLGDAIEGGAIGGVGGAAYDQTQKRGASDVSFNRGDEITVRLNRPMAVRTIVVPADNG